MAAVGTARTDAATTYWRGLEVPSAALDRLSITTVGGVNTFDAGAINIAYE
jgi:hypothetical protein